MTGVYHFISSRALVPIAERLRMTQDGDSPLHEASRLGHIEAMRILLQNGADTEVKNAVRALRQRPTVLRDFAQALWVRSAEVCAARAGPVLAPQDGWTPLHWAAQNGILDVTITLLDKGADVDATSNVRKAFAC